MPLYPDWSQTSTALASIARLLCGLHDAARGFDPQGLTWGDNVADPAGGRFVCHQDVEPSNVVFRDGIAVALLDFEFAALGRPVYDLAQLARLCVPIDDDDDSSPTLRTGPRRSGGRIVAVRRRVDAGDPNAVEMWNRTGGGERYDRRRRW